LYFLAFKLEIFPLGSRCATTLDDSCGPIYERWQYMVLPVLVLSANGVANFSRYMRASMLDVIGQDYIRTARSKGLSSTMIWYRHGMRNALIPIATFLGPAIVGLLGGAVITEQVFNYPGIGFAVYKAFIQRDYPIVMAVTIYASIVTILGYLLSDILYGVIDPRIRY
jgi:peptide/nickel transport system permease protein